MTTTMSSAPQRACAALRTLLCGMLVALAAPDGFALGFRIPNQDAAAIARGNAFVATADNPSAIYYNPAGITQLEGEQVQLGALNYLGINTFYDAPNGTDATSDFQVLPVPQLHFTCSPKDSALSYGLGIYAPFGLGVNWAENTGFRSIAIKSKITYITVNPVIAWQVHPTLSIAFGPNLNYSETMFSRGLLSPTDTLIIKGDDIGGGFNAGILFQPHEQWSLGANYRSASRIEYRGSASYSAGAMVTTKATLDFPQIISAGISYRPTTNWNIEVNVDYTDWNTLNTVLLRGTSAIFGIDLPLQFNWHESWFYQLGVTRQFDDGWFASAGYFYSTETVPSEMFTPAIPDTKLHVASLGVGRQGENWRWVVAAQLIAGPKRDIVNSQPSLIGESANGKYQLIVPALSVSLTRQF